MSSTEASSRTGRPLVDLRVAPEALPEALDRAGRLASIRVSDRAECDLELLATGAFSPLDRFLGRGDHQAVLDGMRTAGGILCPIPIVLPIDADAPVQLDRAVALRNGHNELLAILTVEEIFDWDRREVARSVLGTTDPRHPLVAEMERWGPRLVTGRIDVLRLPTHHDFRSLRRTPAEVRQRLAGRGPIVAFQTRNPLHRVHEEMTRRAIESVDGTLLLHPVVGMTKPGDVDHYTRVRAYQAIAAEYFDPGRIELALLPLAMRMGGPREALWHALIRGNYGADHLIVGRDHASPGLDSEGRPFWGPYDAQELVAAHQDETGVRMIPFRELVYLPGEDRYEEVSRIDEGTETLRISGTQVREQYLARGEVLPPWFTRPSVAEILAESYPPRHRQGFCLWFTGLSGAGKSTTADVLTALLLEKGRPATVLDGDVVRTHLSKGLGFGKDDRDTNVRRIGFVASEIVRHGGVAICAAVSPYRGTRNDVRQLIGDGYLEVFVDTPLTVCEERDTKGLYAKARRGELQGFTGIDDPYEEPQHPEIVLRTVGTTPEENARRIVEVLEERGYLRPAAR